MQDPNDRLRELDKLVNNIEGANRGYESRMMQGMTPQAPSRPGMGWRRDLPDPRDHKLATPPQVLGALPASVDHRSLMPPVVTQGSLGSCTANSASYLFDFQRGREGRPAFGLSRLFQYYNTRGLEGTIDSDAGASIRNTIKAMVDMGACPEYLWPYDPPQYRTIPPQVCYEAGLLNQVVEYMRVDQTPQGIMGALAAGYVIEFGMLIYPQFEQVGASGLVRMPNPTDRPLGGHSGVMCGYYTEANGTVRIINQNTWGTSYGDKGCCYIPMEYLTNPDITADLWVIKLIEPDVAPTPTPPPTPQPWIGERVRTAMAVYGDVPAIGVGETYFVGFSVFLGASGRRYWYIASQDRVFVSEPGVMV